jgi:PKD repeat protein
MVIGFGLMAQQNAAQQPGQTAPNQCGALIQAALESTDSLCSDTTRNQACYGHVLNTAVSRPEVADFRFDAQGDKVLLQDVESLEISPLALDEERWGVVLMQVQATLPDALPGQNVTFILFGDVQMSNAVGTPVEIEAGVVQPANIRVAPSETRPVLASLRVGSTVVANGKALNADGDLWVRVNHDPEREVYGWVRADLIDVTLSDLPDVETDDQTVNPMQAFYFKTGVGQPQCVEAPPDGVLVQTPKGAGKVNFTINGVDVAVGSTLFLRSLDEEDAPETCLFLLEGSSDIGAGGETVELAAGQVTCVPLDEDGIASGVPSAPQWYDSSELSGLSALLPLLSEEIELLEVTPGAVEPTNTPRPRATATPTPTPLPTDQPSQPQDPGAPTPQPTATQLPTCSDDAAIIVPCIPVARFGYVVSGFAVAFSDFSYSDITAVLWDFGDGGTSTDHNPIYGYDAAGCYNVSLRAENPYGFDVTTRVVEILGATGPTANFNDPRDGYTVNFTDTSVAGDSAIVSWVWDFGDGYGSNAQSPTHIYPQGIAATYTVTLTVMDADGLSDTESRTFTLGACEYQPTSSVTLSFDRDFYDPANAEYEIFLKNVDCTYGGSSGVLNQFNTNFTVTVPVGKGFLVRQVAPCTSDLINGIVPAGGTTINVVTSCP